MAEFPALSIFTDAFLADTLHLNAEETGAYLLLLFVAWRSPACAIPDSDKDLAKWARSTPKRWRKIKPRVMAFWVLEDGFWFQKRLKKERDYVNRRAAIARQNGSRGGRPKVDKSITSHNPSGSFWDSQTETKSKAPTPTPIPNKKKEPPLSPAFGRDIAWLNEKGEIELSKQERDYWITRFDDDDRLGLALVAIVPYIQENSRTPFLKQVRAQLARQAADKQDRDRRHTSAVKANKPRDKGAPPANFNFSRYTIHDTQDNTDPIRRYKTGSPEFSAEVERLFQEGFTEDAERIRDRGWCNLYESHVFGELAERILKFIPYDNVSARMRMQKAAKE